MRAAGICGWVLAGVLAGLGVGGCRSGGAGDYVGNAQEKFFPVRGTVVSVDQAKGMVTLRGEAVAGYMGAMTMPYELVNRGIVSELHPGDELTGRLVVKGQEAPKLDQVVVIREADPNALPKVQYHVPAPGDAVPDFKFLNQSGRMVDFKDFRGKVVLLTFIYTRCPVADFCPRMSSNFAEIDKDLAGDKKAYAGTELLSVSFDPTYDTPQVLRSYGGSHTGRFTEEDFRHWEFAAPPVAELGKVEQWFDVGVTGNDPATLQHSLSTVLIGKDGRVLAWYPTNDWKPGDVAAKMEAAAGG